MKVWMLAVFVATSLAVVTPAPAHAAPCYYKSEQTVTPQEYARLRTGMTYREARDVVGSAGELWSSAVLRRPVQEMERVWHTCDPSGQVSMFFQRVSGKGIVLQSFGAYWGLSDPPPHP